MNFDYNLAVVLAETLSEKQSYSQHEYLQQQGGTEEQSATNRYSASVRA
jgi:hypothetical protein